MCSAVYGTVHYEEPLFFSIRVGNSPDFYFDLIKQQGICHRRHRHGVLDFGRPSVAVLPCPGIIPKNHPQ